MHQQNKTTTIKTAADGINTGKKVMKKTYQIISEHIDGGGRRIVYETTRKRDIESFFSRLMRVHKKDGCTIVRRNIGYCDVLSSLGGGRSYWIATA